MLTTSHISWQGTIGLEKHIDTVFDNAAYFTEKIRTREGFRLVLQEPECTNVCFWHIPPSMRGQEDQPDFNERLHKVCSNLCPSSHLWTTDLSGLPRVNYYCISEVRVPIRHEYVYCISDRVMMRIMAVRWTYSFKML